ncbi:MAG: flagellar biosynthetic protein FliO [Firmicutes bacterium]|nr:flagellar biosynthetic protein FliO [Bacillota bacterium]
MDSWEVELAVGWRILGVFALLAIVLYAIRRWMGHALPGVRRGAVRVVDAVPIGLQRHLYLVEVAGRRLLIGATPQALTLLAELEEGTHAERHEEDTPG